MKYANKIGAKYTIVLGDTELENAKATLKAMSSGETKDISLGERFIDDYITYVTELEGDIEF